MSQSTNTPKTLVKPRKGSKEDHRKDNRCNSRLRTSLFIPVRPDEIDDKRIGRIIEMFSNRNSILRISRSDIKNYISILSNAFILDTKLEQAARLLIDWFKVKLYRRKRVSIKEYHELESIPEESVDLEEKTNKSKKVINQLDLSENISPNTNNFIKILYPLKPIPEELGIIESKTKIVFGGGAFSKVISTNVSFR